MSNKSYLLLFQYIAKYEIENNREAPSLETTNVALTQVFKDRNPMIVYFETDREVGKFMYDLIRFKLFCIVVINTVSFPLIVCLKSNGSWRFEEPVAQN